MQHMRVFRQIISIEQKQFWQKWGLSRGYPIHFPTALTITPQGVFGERQTALTSWTTGSVLFI